MTEPLINIDGIWIELGPLPMGEAAEILCARYTEGVRVKHGRRGEDVVGKDRRHYQVKSRRYRSAGRQVEIKNLDFDDLMTIVFETDRQTVRWAGVIARQDFYNWAKRRWSDTNNCYEFSITKEFRALPGMCDVTDELRAFDMLDVYREHFAPAIAKEFPA